MKPSLLLPNRFKKIGLVLLSLGLLVWILTQKELIFTELDKTNKVITLTMSFFCFLFGLYFFTFSKEPIEDEYINQIRLKSFQISSLIQMVFFIFSFILMFLFKNEPNGDEGLSTFLLSSIILYWLVYIVSFNYNLISIKRKRLN
jgi:amino acid permease